MQSIHVKIIFLSNAFNNLFKIIVNFNINFKLYDT